ncbi:hypothetical protein LSH36_263g00000 [Paralvinella palmiformis]|uniref:G-protein coupled receptors family 1 profile domain-containing protein n=1 Tax=Paralvinella palmiformis TaxID=53620 RepID=A0AAD9JK76_9ANNE|nr:hypothetical protein LSH36_263g00000 [Paralvinella palmiformis]
MCRSHAFILTTLVYIFTSSGDRVLQRLNEDIVNGTKVMIPGYSVGANDNGTEAVTSITSHQKRFDNEDTSNKDQGFNLDDHTSTSFSAPTSETKEFLSLADDGYTTTTVYIQIYQSTATSHNGSNEVSSLWWPSLIDYIVMPTSLVVGLFGNVMTMAVMRRAIFQVTPTAIILNLLSAADTAVLLMVPWNAMTFQSLIGFDARGLHWLGCKFFFWTWRTAKMASSWCIVLISLERYIAIIYPLKVRNIITKRSTAYTIAVVCSAIFLFNGVRFAFADVARNGMCLAAIPDNPRHATLAHNLVVLGTSLSAYVPSILVFFLNLTSVSTLMRQSRRRSTLTVGRPVQVTRQHKTNRHLSLMLFGVSFAFQILVTPIAILHVVATLKNVALFHTIELTWLVSRKLAMIMEQLNYCINFYLYVLCSRVFADQFLILIGCDRQVPRRESGEIVHT